MDDVIQPFARGLVFPLDKVLVTQISASASEFELTIKLDGRLTFNSPAHRDAHSNSAAKRPGETGF